MEDNFQPIISCGRLPQDFLVSFSLFDLLFPKVPTESSEVEALENSIVVQSFVLKNIADYVSRNKLKEIRSKLELLCLPVKRSHATLIVELLTGGRVIKDQGENFNEVIFLNLYI